MRKLAEEALKKYPKSESLWINKGLAHLNLNDIETFMNCNKQALKFNPNNTIALINMSKYYLD